MNSVNIKVVCAAHFQFKRNFCLPSVGRRGSRAETEISLHEATEVEYYMVVDGEEQLLSEEDMENIQKNWTKNIKSGHSTQISLPCASL